MHPEWFQLRLAALHWPEREAVSYPPPDSATEPARLLRLPVGREVSVSSDVRVPGRLSSVTAGKVPLVL